MYGQYYVLYDHIWSLNGTVAKSYINKRGLNIAAMSSGRGPNNPNFRDVQDKSLKG